MYYIVLFISDISRENLEDSSTPLYVDRMNMVGHFLRLKSYKNRRRQHVGDSQIYLADR